MLYRLKIAPWVPDQVCSWPEMSGPMSPAWREIAPALRAAALRVLDDERASWAERDRHQATYPGAYVSPVGRKAPAPTFDRSSGPRSLSDALVSDTAIMDMHAAYRLKVIADAWLRAACECVTDDETGRVISRCPQCQVIGDEPDVMVNGHLETRPDRAAYRGAARVKPRARHRRWPDADRTHWVMLPTGDEYAHQLAAPRHWRLTRLAVSIDARVLVGTPGASWEQTAPIRFTRDTDPQRARRKRRAHRRTVTQRTGQRGIARTPWTLSARSLPRAMDRADEATRAVADTWVAVITGTVIGTQVTIGALTFTRDSAATCIAHGHGDIVCGNREIGQRAALAGITPD